MNATSAWTFEVQTNQGRSNVTLTWKRFGTLPSGASATLTDMRTGAQVNLSSVSQYSFLTGAGGETRKFRVDVRQKGSR